MGGAYPNYPGIQGVSGGGAGTNHPNPGGGSTGDPFPGNANDDSPANGWGYDGGPGVENPIGAGGGGAGGWSGWITPDLMHNLIPIEDLGAGGVQAP